MKTIFKRLFYFLVIILLLFVVYGWIHYAPDKSFEELKAKYAYENSQFLEIDDMPVHYRINGEGETLVLIHGTAASLHTWEDWTTILEKDFRVVSLDMPAFGLTGPNAEGNYSLDYYADFLNRFLEKIEIENFSIAGNSLGGAIAWTYATKYPDQVENLILIDATGYPMDKKPPMVFRIAQSNLLSKAMLKITPKSMIEKSVNDVYFNDAKITDTIIERYYDMTLREGNRQAFIDRVRKMEESNHEAIASIKIPTLILWGKYDEWIPAELADKFHKDIEGSELKIYEAGHIPMEEIPNETAYDTKNFLFKKYKSEPEPMELVEDEISN